MPSVFCHPPHQRGLDPRRSGARIVLRDRAGSLLDRARPDLLRAWYRERYEAAIPPGMVPDTALRRRVVDRMLQAHPTPRHGAGYPALRRQLYDDRYFTTFFGKVRPILERRLAEAITGSASMITAAWIEAGRPELPLEQPRTPRKVRRER